MTLNSQRAYIEGLETFNAQARFISDVFELGRNHNDATYTCFLYSSGTYTPTPATPAAASRKHWLSIDFYKENTISTKSVSSSSTTYTPTSASPATASRKHWAPFDFYKENVISTKSVSSSPATYTPTPATPAQPAENIDLQLSFIRKTWFR